MDIKVDVILSDIRRWNKTRYVDSLYDDFSLLEEKRYFPVKIITCNRIRRFLWFPLPIYWTSNVVSPYILYVVFIPLLKSEFSGSHRNEIVESSIDLQKIFLWFLLQISHTDLRCTLNRHEQFLCYEKSQSWHIRVRLIH